MLGYSRPLLLFFRPTTKIYLYLKSLKKSQRPVNSLSFPSGDRQNWTVTELWNSRGPWFLSQSEFPLKLSLYLSRLRVRGQLAGGSQCLLRNYSKLLQVLRTKEGKAVPSPFSAHFLDYPDLSSFSDLLRTVSFHELEDATFQHGGFSAGPSPSLYAHIVLTQDHCFHLRNLKLGLL